MAANTACTRCRHGATRRWWESPRFSNLFLASGSYSWIDLLIILRDNPLIVRKALNGNPMQLLMIHPIRMQVQSCYSLLN
jgi:hypothetical protein